MIYTSKDATLDEMLYNGQISRQEYINRYSPECRQNFHLFCMKNFEIDYETFKNAVIKASLTLLETYGFVGYVDSWSEHSNVFPLCELLELLGIRSEYHEESDSKRSCLKDEIELLSALIV